MWKAGWIVLAFSFSADLHAKSYRSFVHEWTRHKQLYNTVNMQTKIILTATWFSPEFRTAYEKEHIKRKYLDEAEAAVFTAEQERRKGAGDEFFIGFYTRKPYKEFSSGAESFWKAVLTTADGTELEPVRIEPIPITPYERVMFHYLDRWSYAYRIVFPKTDLTPPFTLTMRSVIGQTHLHW